MFEGRTPRFVSAAEITRNFGMWQDRAAQGPLVVTHHGRPRVMMLAVDQYEALTQRSGGGGAGDAGEELESARLSVVLGQIGTAFAAFDATARFVRVNAAAVAHFGLPEDRLLGRSPDELFTGREAMLGAHLADALRTGEEMQVDLPAGPLGERLLRMRLFPYPGGVAATFRNVAGLLGAERAAIEHAAQVEARAAHGGIGVGRLGPRGTFEHVEAPLAAMAGFAAARLVGLRFTDLLALQSRAVANEMVEAVLTGQGARAIDSLLLVAGGGERPIRIALSEIRDGFAVTGAIVMLA